MRIYHGLDEAQRAEEDEAYYERFRGIVEAENHEQKFFGMDRMMECLNENPEGSPYELVDRVHQGVDAFVGDAPRFDDLTMLCVHFIGSEAPEKGVRSTIMMKEMTIEATIENIPVVTDFVNEALETFDCPMKIVTQIDIAIDELFGNIAHYAYDPDTDRKSVV